MQKIKKFFTEHSFALTIAYAGALFLLNALRLFDRNFWYDETFSIELVTHPLSEVLHGTAVDVHPPLYYIILWVFCQIFGHTAAVYHAVSLIPYLGVLILSLSWVRKRFSINTSLILVTLASVLETSIMFNVQARMYAWGEFFMLLSFLSLYEILKENKTAYYVLFTLGSLCAAYTHYYLLIAVAFFYVVLIITAFMRKKTYFKKVLLTCIATVLVYLPWLFVLLDTFGRTSDSYWIERVPFMVESLAFIYADGKPFGYIMAAILFGLTVWFTLVKFNILSEKEENGKTKITFSFKNIKFNTKGVWLFAGLFCIFGTILTGTLVSHLFRPMYITRYIFPVGVVAWLMAGVVISKLKYKNQLTALLMAVVLTVCLIAHTNSLINIYNNHKLLDKTLAATSEKISEGDMIFAENSHYELGVAKYYYPGVNCSTISPESFSDILEEKGRPEGSTEYFLFLYEEISEEFTTALAAQGYSYEAVFENGNVGTYGVSIYQITPAV